MVTHFSGIQFFVSLCTVLARLLCPWDNQSGLPCSPPGDLPNSGIKPESPALQADALSSEPPGKPFYFSRLQFSSVQWLSRVRLFATPWTAAHQASLSFTISRSLLKFTSIESVMSSNHLILCHPLLLLPSVFPASESFPMSQLFTSGGQSIGASASASVLPVNIQGWFPLGLTGLISLLSKGLSKVFSSTTIWKHQFFSSQPF